MPFHPQQSQINSMQVKETLSKVRFCGGAPGGDGDQQGRILLQHRSDVVLLEFRAAFFTYSLNERCRYSMAYVVHLRVHSAAHTRTKRAFH
jgi:hypothetical protein